MRTPEREPLRIAIPATGAGSDQPPDDRFGRCSYFAVFDTTRGDWSFVANPARQEAHGAGIAAARCLIDQQVDLVIGPQLGPKAAEVLAEAAIACQSLPAEGTATVDHVLAAWLEEWERKA